MLTQCITGSVHYLRSLHSARCSCQRNMLQVKDVLFANPIAGAIMRAAGNIPVDRKNKNNQSLFKGSFEGASGHSFFCFHRRSLIERGVHPRSHATRRIHRRIPRRNIPYFSPTTTIQRWDLMARHGIPEIPERASRWKGQGGGEEGGDRSRRIELFG